MAEEANAGLRYAPNPDGDREGWQLLAIVLWILVTGISAVVIAYGAL